ncbi:hypothetical protein CRUP_001299, partial [Coryphaenoides rupestris]
MKRKTRVPAKTATQKDLQIDRILDLMEASDRRNAEYLQQITSNVATITNTIRDGFSLLKDFMLQQPSHMPPHVAYPQGSSESTQMQAPLPPSPGLQQAHTHPGTPTPTPTSQTHDVPFKPECGGEEVSTVDNQCGMKEEEEPQEPPPMVIEIKVEPMGEEEGYNPVGQCALPSPSDIVMEPSSSDSLPVPAVLQDQEEGETEDPTPPPMESYRKSRKHPLVDDENGCDEGQSPNAPKVPRLNGEKSKSLGELKRKEQQWLETHKMSKPKTTVEDSHADEETPQHQKTDYINEIKELKKRVKEKDKEIRRLRRLNIQLQEGLADTIAKSVKEAIQPAQLANSHPVLSSGSHPAENK